MADEETDVDWRRLCLFLHIIAQRPHRSRLHIHETASKRDYMDETAASALRDALESAMRLLSKSELAEEALRILGAISPVYPDCTTPDRGVWLTGPKGTRNALSALVNDISSTVLQNPHKIKKL
jgi:hypothetical protein